MAAPHVSLPAMSPVPAHFAAADSAARRKRSRCNCFFVNIRTGTCEFRWFRYVGTVLQAAHSEASHHRSCPITMREPKKPSSSSTDNFRDATSASPFMVTLLPVQLVVRKVHHPVHPAMRPPLLPGPGSLISQSVPVPSRSGKRAAAKRRSPSLSLKMTELNFKSVPRIE